MKSLNWLSPSATAFSKSFWTAGGASNLWWKTNNYFTLLKSILPTFDDTAVILHNLFIIFNPCFFQIFGQIFSCCKIDIFFEVCHKPAMIWLDSIILCTAPSDVLVPVIPPNHLGSSLIVFSMTWSGGNLLQLPLDLLTEKWPFYEFMVDSWMSKI